MLAADVKRPVVAQTPFARLEEIAPGVWAAVSTHFESNDFTLLCNSGIIQGDDRVMVLEGTMSTKGAQWLSEQAKKLTGKAPTDLVISHFHGDHTNGHSGYPNPRTWITAATKAGAEERFATSDPVIPNFPDVETLSESEPTVVDLGNRLVTLVPRKGHTSSDVTIEISDPNVIWTGDLYFNRVFPNYGDSTPPLLNQFGETLDELNDSTIVVPGHGSVADQSDIQVYRAFLAELETAAKEAHASGEEAVAAAAQYTLPDPFAEWVIWAPDNIERAFKAWYRTLG